MRRSPFDRSLHWVAVRGILMLAATSAALAAGVGPLSGAAEPASLAGRDSDGELPSVSAESLWTQWRGSFRDGSSPGSAWPNDLNGLEAEWRAELGKGYSGPIVSSDRVFVAETVDEETEGARALARDSGELIWQVTWPGSGSVPFFADRNGDWIRATPAFDGEALYVGGMEEVLYKLSADDGEILWSVDFPARFGTGVPDFGFASSPMVQDEAIYVQAANSVVKLSRETGETLWRSLQNDGAIQRSGAFSSPILAEIAGREQLIVQTREILAGLDPGSGQILWEQPVPSFRGMNILTPLVHGDRIFTSTHRNRSFLYEITRGPDGFQSTEVWNQKAQAYMSSPVLIGDAAYLHLGNGRLTVIDLDSGESPWTSKPFGSYWSLVRRGEKILALDAEGELLLLRADGDVPEVLDRTEVSDQPTWAHLAVSGNQLYIRELEGLRAYRLQ